MNTIISNSKSLIGKTSLSMLSKNREASVMSIVRLVHETKKDTDSTSLYGCVRTDNVMRVNF